ncbi:amine oxidase [Chlorella sorokiniana]|uniref:monoamine oxidase n=1 Tax=Chlorella sorokiniana TaxID=3076 RepID=A0A2P6TDT5_CHLSO|nr:amine oxidase [Chlorella sorokiniana]|eukprot:PRW20792.1 amine oxidase [Chlorella sorokiniana]
MRAPVLLALLALAGAAAAGRDLLAQDDPHGRDTQTFIKRTNYNADAVIIGGGFAGLTAARNLARKGHKVVVVEAQASLGGRSSRNYASTRTGQNVTCSPTNKNCPDGVWWYDRGGQWLGMDNSQDRLFAMAVEYGVKTYTAVQSAGQYRFIMGGGTFVGTGDYLDEEIPGGADKARMTQAQINGFAAYQKVSNDLYDIVDQVKNYLKNPWAYPRVEEFDAITFKQFVESKTQDVLGKQLLYWMYCEANGGYTPSSISVFEMARILANMLDGGGEEKLFFGAAGQFVDLMAKEIKNRGGIILTSNPVRHIAQDGYGLVAYTDYAQIVAKYSVVAMPPHLSGRITYDPPLPGRRAQLTQRFPMGTTVKCIGLFKTPFWRQRNGGALNGDNVVALAIQPGTIVNEMFDISPPYPDAPGILASFLYDEVALGLTEQGPAAMEKFVLQRWATMMNDDRILTQSVNFHYVNWPEEQWVGGAYNAFASPGTWKIWGKSMYAPFGRVHWAGTEYAFKWLGYYDGAIRTGEDAAAKISALLGAKRESRLRHRSTMRAPVLLALLALAGAAAAGRDLLAQDNPHGRDTQTFIKRTAVNVDVIVVGGGFAGLTTARNLARQGRKVAVVEAQESLGGRSQRNYATTRAGKNVTAGCPANLCPEGVWWYDRGGQWLGMTNSQDRLYAMSQEYGVKTYTIPQANGQYRFVMGGGAVLNDGGWFDSDVPTAAERRGMTKAQIDGIAGYQKAADALYEIVDQVKNYLKNPWTYPRVVELDSITFKQFVETQTQNQIGRQLMYWLYCDANGGYSPASISVFEMARILAGYLDGGSEEKLFFGGAGQFVELMAKEIKNRGGVILTSNPVRHIAQDANVVAVYTDTHVLTGKFVTVAMPPHLSGRITYDPPLPSRRAQLTQRFPMGTTVKCIALFNNPFWRQSNGGAQSGDGVVALAIQPGAIVNEVFDISPPYPGAPGILAGFLFDEVALGLTEQGPAALEKFVLQRWATMMNDNRIMTQSVNFIYINWPEEQWVGGAYNGFTSPGTWSIWGKSMYAPFGRVHWAGTEYAFKWLGYYDGAIRSAATCFAGVAAAAPLAAASTTPSGITGARTLLLALEQAPATPAVAAATQQGGLARAARSLSTRLDSLLNGPAVASVAGSKLGASPALVTELARLLASSSAQPALDKLFASGGRLAQLAPPYNRSARCAALSKLEGVSRQTKACYCDTTKRQPWPRCDALLHLELMAAGSQLDAVAQEVRATLGSWQGVQQQAPATRRLMGRLGTSWQAPKRCAGLSPEKCADTKKGGSGPLLGGGARCNNANALELLTTAVQTGCGSFACRLNMEPLPLALNLNLTGCIPVLKLRDSNGDGVTGEGDTVALCRQGQCSSLPFATAAQWATMAPHFDTGLSGGLGACLGFPTLAALLQKWGWLNGGGEWCLGGSASASWYPLKCQVGFAGNVAAGLADQAVWADLTGRINYADGASNAACKAFAPVDPSWKSNDFCCWAAGRGVLVERLGWSILGFNNVLTARLLNSPIKC